MGKKPIGNLIYASLFCLLGKTKCLRFGNKIFIGREVHLLTAVTVLLIQLWEANCKNSSCILQLDFTFPFFALSLSLHVEEDFL